MVSKRLNAIVSLITEDNNIADIGSDHGYVLIELRKSGFKSKLLGVENKKQPYERLKKNIRLNGLEDIECSLSDGLDEVNEDYKTIILAGMGFDTISEIILKNVKKIENIDKIVVDSHTSKENVRNFFINYGYDIENELTIEEANKYYDVISFKKTDAIKKYSDIELMYGPINLKRKDSQFIDYLKHELTDTERIINLIADKSDERKQKLISKYNLISEILSNEN